MATLRSVADPMWIIALCYVLVI